MVQRVVVVLNVRTQPTAVASRGIDPEPGLRFGAQVAGTVSAGCHFDVREGGSRARVEFVLDAGVGNLDLVVDHGQLQLVGDLLADLG